MGRSIAVMAYHCRIRSGVMWRSGTVASWGVAAGPAVSGSERGSGPPASAPPTRSRHRRCAEGGVTLVSKPVGSDVARLVAARRKPSHVAEPGLAALASAHTSFAPRDIYVPDEECMRVWVCPRLSDISDCKRRSAGHIGWSGHVSQKLMESGSHPVSQRRRCVAYRHSFCRDAAASH